MWSTPPPSIWSNGVQCKHPAATPQAPDSLSHLYPTSDGWGGPGANSTATLTEISLSSSRSLSLSSRSRPSSHLAATAHRRRANDYWRNDWFQIALLIERLWGWRANGVGGGGDDKYRRSCLWAAWPFLMIVREKINVIVLDKSSTVHLR